MKKHKIYYTFITLVTLVFVACSNDDSNNSNSLVKNLIRDQVNQHILPSISNFVNEANTLNSLINTYIDQPTEANLIATKQQWKTTTLAYEKTYTYHIGEVRDRFLHTAIYNWPITTEVIEFVIADNDEITESIINSLSTRSKSIAAVEYLLHKADVASVNTEFLNSEKRRTYLRLCGQFIVSQAIRLQNIWVATGENYAETFINNNASGIDGSFSLYFNGLHNLIDTDKVTKVGKPAGLENSQVINPELTQAFYSRSSLDIIAINIQTLEDSYFNNQGLGIEDYVNSIAGGEELNAVIQAKIDELQVAINAIPNSLYHAVTNNHQLVEQLHIKLEELRVLFAVDLQSRLSIVITSTDNDGD